MNNPLVSIIIPTFNRAHLIGETLNSVLAQTYENWECIIVDDGSTDHTVEVVNAYVQKDSRFQLHYRPADRLPGGNAARNYGFEVSKGEYVNWFDSDDLMSEILLEKKMKLFIANPLAEFVLCGFKMFKELDWISNDKWLVVDKQNVNERFLSKQIVLNTPIILWKRKSVSDVSFDENLTRAQDVDFISKVFDTCSMKFEILPLSLIYVRLHESTITSNYQFGKKKDILSEITVRKHILFKNIENENSEFREKILNLYLIAVRKALVSRNYNVYFKEIMFNLFLKKAIKLRLLLIGILYVFFKKGMTEYSRILNQ